MNVAVDATSLAAAQDVNGDGTLEVVVESSFSNFGVLAGGISIITLAAGTPRELAGFPETTDDPCGSIESVAQHGATFSQLLVTRGPRPQFKLVQLQEPCAPR